MTEGKPIEILCPACRGESLLLRKPEYDGFTKVGESLSCASCGYVFENEEDVPYKGRSEVKVFTDADRPAAVEVFEEDEAARLCHRCANYVVNPFMQWCSLHRKEVESTDSCPDFRLQEKKEEE